MNQPPDRLTAHCPAHFIKVYGSFQSSIGSVASYRVVTCESIVTHGQLGYGTIEEPPAPVAVGAGAVFTAVNQGWITPLEQIGRLVGALKYDQDSWDGHYYFYVFKQGKLERARQILMVIVSGISIINAAEQNNA